ncbi:retrovirus-related pol polyprotein from transposon TNT 1-94, partial [Tanacetum coccineum]
DGPLEYVTKAMACVSVVASRYPSTKNQLRTSSNPINQATIQDGPVRNNVVGQGKVIKCYNCQGEGHMARHCTRPKQPRNSAWYQEKMLLVQAQENGQVLDEEQLAFLEDIGTPEGHTA